MSSWREAELTRLAPSHAQAARICRLKQQSIGWPSIASPQPTCSTNADNSLGSSAADAVALAAASSTAHASPCRSRSSVATSRPDSLKPGGQGRGRGAAAIGGEEQCAVPQQTEEPDTSLQQ